MTKCWEELPENRPTFAELRTELEAMMSVDKAYLDLTNIEETTEYMNLGSGSEDEAVDELGGRRSAHVFSREVRCCQRDVFLASLLLSIQSFRSFFNLIDIIRSGTKTAPTLQSLNRLVYNFHITVEDYR